MPLNRYFYITWILILGTLPACSLVRSPEKTLVRVQERFVEASIAGVGEAKGGIMVSDLERVTSDPGALDVGDMVVVQRLEDGVSIRPIFQVEKIVREEGGLTELEKRLLVGKFRDGTSQRTDFSGELDVSRWELWKISRADGKGALEDIREAIDDSKPAMKFWVKGEMGEGRASVLEEVYARMAEGKLGRSVPEGAGELKKTLSDGLRLVEARLIAGDEIYAMGKVMTTELVTGGILAKEGKEEELAEGKIRAAAVTAFGREMVPGGRRSEVSRDLGKGTAVFRLPAKTCWALTGFRVKRPMGGGLEVDAKERLRW